MPKSTQGTLSANHRVAKAVQRSGTQAIERASLLVRVIASHSRIGLGIGEIVALSNLERTTVYRILNCLISEGLVMREGGSGRYFLGPLAFEVGLAAAPRFNLAHICSPWICRIAEQSEDTVFLIVRSGYDSVCIDRQAGSFPVKVFTMDVGARRPLGVGAGSIAMMMRLTDDAVDDIVSMNGARFGAYDDMSAKSVLKGLVQARERDYALHEFRTSIGITTVSLPIVNRFGHPFAAISIGAVTSRMLAARQKELVSMLRSEIALLEKAMSQMTSVGMQ